MESLSSFSFVIYNLETHQTENLVPESEEKLLLKMGDIPRSELAVESLYTKIFGYKISNLDSRHKNTIKHVFGLCHHYENNNSSSLPIEALELLREDLVEKLDLSNRAKPIEIINQDGIPDFLAYNQDDNRYVFIEAKWVDEDLLPSQIEWYSMFSFLPIRIVYVFPNIEGANEHAHRLENKLRRKLV